MKLYKVAVTETRRKVVTVKAEDEHGAHQRAYDAWECAEFVLDDDDFDGAEIYVIGEAEEVEGTKVATKEV